MFPNVPFCPELANSSGTLHAEGIEGVVLRYGQLYGPGTYFAPDGDVARQARQRRVAIVGGGRGVYNVMDDDPAPARDWIPLFAQAAGAPRQPRVPRWVGSLMAGGWAVATLTAGRGASNRRAETELGWQPRYRSWREGFFVRDEPHVLG